MDHLSDKEQRDLIVRVIKQYAPAIIIGILIAFGGRYGWQLWQTSKDQRAMQASRLYQTIVNNGPAADQLLLRLTDKYPQTPYAALAELHVAQTAVEKGALDDAAGHLNWIVTHQKNPVLTDIARLRLARVRLAQKKPEQALALLTNTQTTVFQSAVDAEKGDVYLALKQKDKARAAYKHALLTMANPQFKALLAMKLAQLGHYHD